MKDREGRGGYEISTGTAAILNPCNHKSTFIYIVFVLILLPAQIALIVPPFPRLTLLWSLYSGPKLRAGDGPRET